MLETKQLTIQSKSVQITQFSCRDAIKLSVQTMQYFGHAYFDILTTIMQQTKNLTDEQVLEATDDINLSLMQALKNLPDKINANEFESYCYKMLAKTIVVNEFVTHENFEEIFAANWSLLYRVLFEVIKFNFGGFFFDLVSIIRDEIQ